jgi:chemotaxis protein MotB
MKPRYLQTEVSNRDRWTISYLDVMTILLIFFVAVAAKSQLVSTPPPAPAPKAVVIEDKKVEEKKPEPEKPKTNLPEIQEKLKELDPHLDARGLVISLPQAILFGPGDDRISDDALPTVKRIADALSETSNHVILIGHADSSPIHNKRFKNNWELSAARGLRLLEVLTGRYGIDESRLSVASDGANRPTDSNDTPDGRANNRRVEIVIEEAAANGQWPVASKTAASGQSPEPSKTALDTSH